MSKSNDYESRPVIWLIGGAAVAVGLAWFLLTGMLWHLPVIAAGIWAGSLVVKSVAEPPKGRKKK